MEIMHLTLRARDTRNELHFEVQRRTHAQVFRNRKKDLVRKAKHKEAYCW